jgi:hypothetical protein
MTDEERETFFTICDYLESLLIDALQLGLPPVIATDINIALDEARALLNVEDKDPTPWCSGCGAMRPADCHCGPIADNE